jgi:hypothetical protein
VDIRIRKGGTVMNPPETIDGVDEVLICTSDGSPVMYVLEMEGKVHITSATDPGFKDMLDMAGVDVRSLPAAKVINVPR